MRRWRHPTSRDLWVAARPAPTNFIDVAQQPIETGLSLTLPPAVRHHRLPPELRHAPNSHLEKIVFLQGPPARSQRGRGSGFASTRASRPQGLRASRGASRILSRPPKILGQGLGFWGGSQHPGLQGPPRVRGLQGPPGASRAGASGPQNVL